MGEILKKIKEENKNTAQYYKDNTMFFFEKYKTSSKEILIPLHPISFNNNKISFSFSI